MSRARNQQQVNRSIFDPEDEGDMFFRNVNVGISQARNQPAAGG
jgi:hypothetical protein